MELHQQEIHPDFKKWFPRPLPKDSSSDPLMRVFCFHGAGMDFTVWTTTGSPKAPMPNSLASLCARESIQLLAAQLPGRGVRSKEALPPSIQACAKEVLDVVEPLICTTVPYVLIGYSMGCWIAYELCCAINNRRQEIPSIRLPERVILASMISPTVPQAKRPWGITASLSTEKFQGELRGWSCNEVLFQPDLWKTYEPMLRNDHKLLDDYICTMPEKPLNVPCTIFRARGDLKLQDDTLFAGWFSVFNQNHHAQAFALSPADTSTTETSAEDRNSPDKVILTDGNISPQTGITQGIANLTIRPSGGSPNIEKNQNGSESREKYTKTDIQERVQCSSSLNSDNEKSTQTSATKFPAEEAYRNQTCHSRVHLLEGNHGLMYDPQRRSQFFEEVEKILDHHTLDITYGG